MNIKQINQIRVTNRLINIAKGFIGTGLVTVAVMAASNVSFGTSNEVAFDEYDVTTDCTRAHTDIELVACFGIEPSHVAVNE